MSILSELSRITNIRNNIRTKLIALGILNNANASLSDCYTGINGIVAKAAATITPSTSSQTAVPSGRFTTGAVTVAAIPNQKSDSGNVTLTSSSATKSYAAGYYANAHGATVPVYTGW